MSDLSHDRCGAGHACCDDPSGPPLHDHFLIPDDCPSCERTITAGSDRTEHYERAYRSAMRGAPLTLAHLGPNDQTMRLARNGYEDGLADRPDDDKAER